MEGFDDGNFVGPKLGIEEGKNDGVIDGSVVGSTTGIELGGLKGVVDDGNKEYD